MLINAYLFELASSAQLNCHNIYSPRALRTAMQIEIMIGDLHNLTLLLKCHSLFRRTIHIPSPCLHLHKDQVAGVFSYKIDLARATTKVPL
jgi:hypothetical protein